MAVKGLTRREFLKRSGGTGLVLGAATLLPCPVLGAGETSVVHTVLGRGPGDLYDMGRRAAEALGIHAGGDLSGKSIFIKPNLVALGGAFSYDPRTGDCTKAEILVGIAEQCLQAGADRVSIGDAAQGLWWDWHGLRFFPGNVLFGADNLKDAADRLREAYPLQQLELLCLNHLNQWELIPSSSDHELMQPGLRIARAFAEADHVISVPVLKSHMLADFTCSMKNYVGLTPSLPPYGTGVGRDKVHEAYANISFAGEEKAGIEACFLDIVKWRQDTGRQDFAVIDGSIGVEGNGPATFLGLGQTIDLSERTPAGSYFLLASSDLVAADSTAGRIMNRRADSVKQLRMAKAMDLGETYWIRLKGDAGIDDLKIGDFKKAMQFPDWGMSLAGDTPQTGPASRDPSRIFNTAAGLALPLGAACFMKRLLRPPPPGDDR